MIPVCTYENLYVFVWEKMHSVLTRKALIKIIVGWTNSKQVVSDRDSPFSSAYYDNFLKCNIAQRILVSPHHQGGAIVWEPVVGTQRDNKVGFLTSIFCVCCLSPSEISIKLIYIFIVLYIDFGANPVFALIIVSLNFCICLSLHDFPVPSCFFI